MSKEEMDDTLCHKVKQTNKNKSFVALVVILTFAMLFCFFSLAVKRA